MKASAKTQKPKLPAKIAKPAASKRRPSQLTRPTRRSLFAPRKRTVLIILIICFATILASALYARHQADLNSQTKQDQAYEDDKAQFTKVEAEMQTAYDAMIAAAGTPDKSSTAKECSRESLKFEEGQLSCAIDYEFAYPVDTYAQATELTIKVQNGALSQGYTLTSQSESAEKLNPQAQTGQYARIGLEKNNAAKCELYFEYVKPESAIGFESINSPHIARYVFGCSKDMEVPIYPLAQ